jgi:hypothetical protein
VGQVSPANEGDGNAPCSGFDETRLATIKPTALIGLFRNPELKGVAQEVEATLVLIMNEAAG